MKPKEVREIYAAHNRYWDEHRPELRRLRSAYMCRYWAKQESPDQILIETSRAYEYVEGYVSSLFARSPAVIVQGDLRGDGDPETVQALANNYMTTIQTQLEDCTRLALIYPCAFMKMIPNEHKDPFRRVDVTAVSPWDVIVDTDAGSWKTQRYVAHRYYITLHEARQKYGSKKFATHALMRFLDEAVGSEEHGLSPESATEEHGPRFEYVQIVEFYDIEKDKLHIWSPDYANGDRFVETGVSVKEGVGEELTEVKYDEIPFKDSSGAPIVPIVPLFYSRQPDLPMRGYSPLRRVYDQVQESNIIRTYQASMVRRAARQWVVEKGVFDAEAMAKLAQGVDGEFIEVEISQGQEIAGSILSVPHTPVPPELESYIQQVQEDFERGSILAPFTRGESTRATATEITALAAYSSSEVGRLARERDNVIEGIARLYIAMMRLYIDDVGETIVVSGEPKTVLGSHLDGEFKFFAQDSGATPVSEAVKKQEFFQVMPILGQLGVPPAQILAEIVRMLDLPQSFVEAVGAMPTPAGPNVPQNPAEGARTQSTSLAGQGLPSPGDISQLLP